MNSASRGVSPPPAAVAIFTGALRASVSSTRRFARAIALGSWFAASVSGSATGVAGRRKTCDVPSCAVVKPDVRSSGEGGAVTVGVRSIGRSIWGTASEKIPPPPRASAMRRSSMAKRRRRSEISRTSSWEKLWRPAFSRTSTRPMIRPSR